MTLKSLFPFIIFIFYVSPIVSQTELKDVSAKVLQVGIAGSEPFVFTDSNKGISIEVWEQIAKKKLWKYEYEHYNSVDDALFALKKGNIDVVVGPISITAHRMETLQFSQPFYNSSISIISRIESESIWQKIKQLISIELLMAIGVFLIILAIVGTLLWLAEHKKQPKHFSHKPVQGIGTGMWLAIVTMSTTGYGDKAPITLLGRIIAGSWMVISILFATTMVAGIASTLSHSSLESSTISNIEQLSGKQTATISGSTSKDFLKKTNAKVNAVSNLREAIDKLKNAEVDAVVFDRPQLLYYLKENKIDNLYISKAEYFKQGYGFAFTTKSKLVREINQPLLELAENQDIEKIIHTYIEKDE